MFKRILVPLDGSKLAEAVLPQVRELATALGAEVLLLRVAIAHGRQPLPDEAEIMHHAESCLERAAERLKAEGVRVRTAVRYGETVEEILGEIADDHVDLVAMASHGRSGLNRLMMGSIAARIVQHASIPIFILHAKDEEAD